MGYPTIEKFDVRFVERTLINVKTFDDPNKFTHLINSLVGLIFIPHEFSLATKNKHAVKFLNQPISAFPLLTKIFSGQVTLRDESQKEFTQSKFFYKDKLGKVCDAKSTKVGELVRLFRNGIAHQHITPVGEGSYWKGVIVKNFASEKKARDGDFNFETFLNQRELREFATFIASEYVKERSAK